MARGKSNVIIKICQVVSVNDNADGERIKVYLEPEDNGKSIDDIPFVHPLLPKILHVKPKIGEMVLVILTEVDNGYSTRYYIGPIISQPQFMDESNQHNSTLLYNGLSIPDESLSMNPESEGAFAKNEDIAFYGRKKNDIILSDNDVKIRCGSRLKRGGKVIFNRSNPSYILLRHNDDNIKYVDKNNKDGEYSSSATIVADNINLISNKNCPFKVNDRKNLINDSEMEKILINAHQLPYGDILVDFLKRFVKVFSTHTHPYPGETPCTPDDYNEVINYNLEDILNNNIKMY